MNSSEYVSHTDHASIKSRVLKRIVELWGIPSKDMVDPVIKLIVDILAYELAGLGQELEESNMLLMEKLAGILLPGPWLLPRPYHALAEAEPIEPQMILDRNNLFFIPSRQYDHLGEEEVFDVFFSPLGKNRLLKGRVKYAAGRQSLYQLDKEGRKVRLAVGRSQSKVIDRTLWLGLNLDSNITELQRLDLHVQLGELAHHFGPLLEQCTWTTSSGTPLRMEFTPFIKETNGSGHSDEEGPKAPNLFHSVLTDISDYYRGQFLTLRSLEEQQIPIKRLSLPEEFAQEYGTGFQEELTEPCFWLKIDFPPAFSAEILDKLLFRVNVIPVICRKSYYGQTKVKKQTKIIPLPVGERFSFFDMDRVYDTNGKQFRQRSLQEFKVEAGYFHIHKGVLTRFDQRSAGEQIAKLLRVVREEGSVMAAIGREQTLTNLNNLNQEINAMQKRLDRTKSISKTENNFMVLQPFQESGTVEFEYWGIMGKESQTVTAGDIMQQYQDLNVAPGSARLLTRPMGGTKRKTEDQKIRALRYGLLTRDRIVSREDIRQFLFFSLGDLLDKVEISDGVSISQDPRKGLIRTIDIWLFPSSQGQDAMKILRSRLPGLNHQLNRRSILSAQYTLKIIPPQPSHQESNL